MTVNSPSERKRRKIASEGDELVNQTDHVYHKKCNRETVTSVDSNILSQQMIVQLVEDCKKTNHPTPMDLCSRILSQQQTMIPIADTNNENNKSIKTMIKQTLEFLQTSCILYDKSTMRQTVHSYNTNNVHESNKIDQWRDSLLRMIQIQVMLRIKLFTHFSSTQDVQSSFLSSYAKLFSKKTAKVRSIKKNNIELFKFGLICSSLTWYFFLVLPRERKVINTLHLSILLLNCVHSLN